MFPVHIQDWNWPEGIQPSQDINNNFMVTFPNRGETYQATIGGHPRMDNDTMMWLTQLLQQRYALEHGVLPDPVGVRNAIEEALLHDRQVFEAYQRWLEQMNGFKQEKPPFQYVERDSFEVERME
jgi:hypothetical protein